MALDQSTEYMLFSYVTRKKLQQNIFDPSEVTVASAAEILIRKLKSK